MNFFLGHNALVTSSVSLMGLFFRSGLLLEPELCSVSFRLGLDSDLGTSLDGVFHHLIRLDLQLNSASRITVFTWSENFMLSPSHMPPGQGAGTSPSCISVLFLVLSCILMCAGI